MCRASASVSASTGKRQDRAHDGSSVGLLMVSSRFRGRKRETTASSVCSRGQPGRIGREGNERDSMDRRSGFLRGGQGCRRLVYRAMNNE